MLAPEDARSFIAQCQRVYRDWTSALWGHFRSHTSALAGLFCLQVVAYSYLFTTLTFSNHTFPNIWIYPYPSFKTLGEGRWLADLLIAAQGGSGVPSFQMVCAALLQGINGILLARLIGIRSRYQILILGGVLSLYPLFLDYYSFAVDHLSFTLGDTLCLLGALVWLRAEQVKTRILGSSALFAAAIGIYAPKVALAALLLLACAALRLTEESAKTAPAGEATTTRNASFALREVAIAAGSLIAALIIAAIVTKLTITMDLGVRTHINGPVEAMLEIRNSYRDTYRYFRYQIGGLPPWGFIIPGLAILLGSISLLTRTAKVKSSRLLPCILILALIPLALQAPWIINNEAWRHAGRIQSANGYLLVFLLGCALRSRRLRPASIALGACCT